VTRLVIGVITIIGLPDVVSHKGECFFIKIGIDDVYENICKTDIIRNQS